MKLKFFRIETAMDLKNNQIKTIELCKNFSFINDNFLNMKLAQNLIKFYQ